MADPVTDKLIVEVARLGAAAETLRRINVACVAGIPKHGLWPAASAIIAAYESATPLNSPIGT